MSKLINALQLPLLSINSFIHKTPRYKGTFPKVRRWYRLDLPGRLCSEGSPYYAYLKKGTVNKTVVYFAGGGLSWNEKTAAAPLTVKGLLCGKEGYYYPYVKSYLELGMTGLLEADDPRNPFNEWNYIYLPYATGDFHIGNNDYPYTDGKGQRRVLHHHGMRNVRSVMEASPEEFFSAEQVLVTGESAGAFACIALVPDIAKDFKSCGNFIVLADSAQLYAREWKAILRGVWKADRAYSDCLGGDGQLVRDWFVRAHREMGEKAVLLHTISPWDGILSTYQNKLSHNDYSLTGTAIQEFREKLEQCVTELSHTIPAYRFFLFDYGRNNATGAATHTLIRSPKYLYDTAMDGTTLGRWLADAASHGCTGNIGMRCLGGGSKQ